MTQMFRHRRCREEVDEAGADAGIGRRQFGQELERRCRTILRLLAEANPTAQDDIADPIDIARARCQAHMR